jgi:hypothetical protein
MPPKKYLPSFIKKRILRKLNKDRRSYEKLYDEASNLGEPIRTTLYASRADELKTVIRYIKSL